MAFNWVEGVAPVSQIVKAIVTDVTSATSNNWTLEYPATISEISTVAILSTSTTFDKTFYLKIEKEEEVLNHLEMTIGTELNDAKDDLEEGKHSETALLAWYRNISDIYIGNWLPVSYWLSFNEDFINIVVEGDSSPDIEPYDHYLISYAYIGAVKSYEGADEDTTYNFHLTTGSDLMPTLATTYGLRTGTGVTDIVAVGTRTGVPYQAHYPTFVASNPYMDKNFIGPSKYTHKHHVSEIVVTHAVDRERGMFQNALVLDRSAIFHLDELYKDKGEPTEEIWKMFNINAPYSFLNNSANVFYGVILRKA